MDIYGRLLERYGPQHWWPADTRLEVMVGAVLTQATTWTNVERAIANLKAGGVFSAQHLRALNEKQLAGLIYPSGYYNAKARKLKALVEFLGRRFGDDLDAMAGVEADVLRTELLGVHGIGEETADDILLYAMNKPSFVIDSYTRRIFERLALTPGKWPYSAYRAFFTDNLPAETDLFGQYHALLVHHGKYICRKHPKCQGCCLLDICAAGQASAALP